MKTHKTLLVVSIFAFLLSGCASQKAFVSLPEPVQKELQSTTVYIKECKKELEADVENSNLTTYTGGGLLVALVDSAIVAHRQDTANEAMMNLHKEIDTFNFQENFRDKLAGQLQNTEWLNVKEVNFVNELNDEVMKELVKKEKNDSMLISRFQYKLNPDFTVLTGTLYLEAYPINPRIKKIVNCEESLKTPIFKFNVSATHALPTKGQDIKENAALWAQDNGAYLRNALNSILREVLLKVERVLKNPNHLPEDV